MSQENIKLINSNDEINNLLSKINNDIKDIEDILNNVNNAALTLSEKKWNTKEKMKMEAEFLPYLDIMNKKYPDYLRERLVFVKDAVQKYMNRDTELGHEAIDKMEA